MRTYSPGGLLIAFAAAPNSFAARHLVVIVYGVDYQGQGMDYAEIAEELDTGKNTPRRWVTGIINELSVLLWGIDEERVK